MYSLSNSSLTEGYINVYTYELYKGDGNTANEEAN